MAMNCMNICTLNRITFQLDCLLRSNSCPFLVSPLNREMNERAKGGAWFREYSFVISLDSSRQIKQPIADPQ